MKPFNGVGESHFLMLENENDLKESLKQIYRLFIGTIRLLELQGHKGTLSLFPDEYTTTEGAQAGGIPDSSIDPNCRVFANRDTAEKTLWPKNCKLLEIGVGNGNHAVSIIEATKASSYIGIDINLSQLCKDAHDKLKSYSNQTSISYADDYFLF